MGTCLSDFWARLSVKSQHPYLAGLNPNNPGTFCVFYSNYTLLPHYVDTFSLSLLSVLRDSNCQHSRGMRRQWCSTDIKCGYASVWFIFLRIRSKTWVALFVSICTWRRRKTCQQKTQHSLDHVLIFSLSYRFKAVGQSQLILVPQHLKIV